MRRCLPGNNLSAGSYRLEFAVGDYFAARGDDDAAAISRCRSNRFQSRRVRDATITFRCSFRHGLTPPTAAVSVMHRFDLIIRGGRVLTPEGERVLDIGVCDGRIEELSPAISGNGHRGNRRERIARISRLDRCRTFISTSRAEPNGKDSPPARPPWRRAAERVSSKCR